MKLHELPKTANRAKKVKRLGCGNGSGHGKTASRGNKGGNARSGYSTPRNFSGIPLYRRFPKRGFNNANFRAHYNLVFLTDLEKKLPADFSAIVNREVLLNLNVLDDPFLPIKLLGNGEWTRSVSFQLDKVTAGAKAKIEAAGGKVIAE